MQKEEEARLKKRIVFKSLRDMPPMAVSLGTTLVNKTGTWRYLRPIYDPKRPPCNDACPAGNDIQGFIYLTTKGKLREAWELIRQTSPFPGVCGRVCYHPCEDACNRGEFDEPIAIHELERLVADEGIKLGSREMIAEVQSVQPRPQRVAIIGAGPAGLTCAYFLAQKGYSVTVFEAESKPGGMLRLGIPKYRLPRDVLDQEINLIEALGVEIKTGIKLGENLELEDLHEYDAVFISTGAHRSRDINIPGEEVQPQGVIHGLTFLKELNLGKQVDIGKRVVVIGGGNTAIDAARSALRLGKQPVIVYRRTRAEMPAIAEEIEAAEEEGIEIRFLAAPIEVLSGNGRLKGAKFIKMKLGEPDESGRRRPVPVTGSEFTMELDTLILAIGESPDLSFLPEGMKLNPDGIVNDPALAGLDLAIFSGGDAATGAGTVVEAIGSGRRGAENIDRFFRGIEEEQIEPPEIVPFEGINLDYFTTQKRVAVEAIPVEERVTSFIEVNQGLGKEQGTAEAERCFSCGVCNQCDNCLIFCPDVAISRLNDEYEVDYDYCKGCGICAEECPRDVIRMIEEGK